MKEDDCIKSESIKNLNMRLKEAQK